jgi:hypothetical protein
VCNVGTATYVEGEVVIDRFRCQACKCFAGSVTACATIPFCNRTEAVCSVANRTLMVGQEVDVSRCKRCRCVAAPFDTNTFAAAQTQLVCFETSSACREPAQCVRNNTVYTLNSVVIEGCDQCYCSESGWVCRRLQDTTVCPDPRTPDLDFCLFGDAVLKVNQTVEVSACRVCVCVGSNSATTASSGVNSAGLRCFDRSRCNTTAPPTATATATASPLPPVDPPMCYDGNGRGFLPGSKIPTKDGCGVCVCGFDDLISTRPSTSAQWICRPVLSASNSIGFNNQNGACCALNNITYPAGWSADIIDRDTCRRCQCLRNGTLMCVVIPSCGICTDNGTRYLPGESKPNANGCGRCDCSNGQFVCPSAADAECKRTCVTIRLTIVLTNNVSAGLNAHIDNSSITAKLNALFGIDNRWYFESYVSTPIDARIVIVIRCFDTNRSSATDAGADISSDVDASFAVGGTPPSSVQSEVVDQGTDSNPTAATDSSDASRSLSSTIALLLLFLLAIVFA